MNQTVRYIVIALAVLLALYLLWLLLPMGGEQEENGEDTAVENGLPADIPPPPPPPSFDGANTPPPPTEQDLNAEVEGDASTASGGSDGAGDPVMQ